MTRPRSQVVSLATTPYYHCISRCVRRAWLCGDDRYSGKNFDHRKAWVVERLTLLAEVFTIAIASYSVLSNHYHVVLHVDQARSNALSDEEVVQRWTRLFKGPAYVQRQKAGKLLTKAETAQLSRTVRQWRERLCSISWFMRCINEHLARRANAEDECKGRFWEARFKSQALLDESALLSCMTYVDLNPIRAGITDKLQDSDFTSIQDRIRELQAAKGHADKAVKGENAHPGLMQFDDSLHKDQASACIPFKLRDYLELVDWTGRISRQDKGHIAAKQPPLLSVLGLSGQEWQVLALHAQKQSVSMFHGGDKIVTLRNRKPTRRVA